ncbi:lactonase family protein [Alicyclobacillus fastidiosus]|uniref:Lactonase family protein n=1 Tax=Alicyclobacillus fastidiosus TaxID=392011 RepID=A0ABV5AJ18_9BACL|nr:lactonase family protein [Alicyclobacillus fastidiosus]WEH07805.1 lactonase family protein [Alicyclobacillus fastidiosus]
MTDRGIARYLIFTGTYEPQDRPGIYTYILDVARERIEPSAVYTGIAHPSFLTVDTRSERLFAVSETVTEGHVVSFHYHPHTGELSEINRQPTGGCEPCHLSVDETGRWLLAVNYRTGSICLYPIDSNGAIQPMQQQILHDGKSVHVERQESSHPHAIFPIPGTPLWLVPDLGADRLYVYELDAVLGQLSRKSMTTTAPGMGPRHVAFHPASPWVYVVNELASSVTRYTVDPSTGELTSLETISAVPDSYRGDNTTADIHIADDGSYLYVSNRGHDSIAEYRVEEDGTLSLLGWTPSGGQVPRNFALLSGTPCLLVANQASNNLVLMRQSDDGRLKASGIDITVPSPVCIQSIPMANALDPH